jgi:hypothetical protein
MDEELRQYLDAMEGRITARGEALEGRIMAQMNDQQERLLDRLASLERDFLNTKGFLIEDAIVSGRRWMGS